MFVVGSVLRSPGHGVMVHEEVRPSALVLHRNSQGLLLFSRTFSIWLQKYQKYQSPEDKTMMAIGPLLNNLGPL